MRVAAAEHQDVAPGGDQQAELFAHIGARSKAHRRVQLYMLMVCADLLTFLIGFYLAGTIRFNDGGAHQFADVLLVLTPMFLVISFERGAYSVTALRRWTTGLRQSLTSLFLAALATLAIGFAWKISSDYSRLFMGLGVASSAVLIALARYGVHRLARRLLPNGPVEEVLLADMPLIGPAGTHRVLNARALGLRPRLDCPVSLDRLGRALHQADRVLVACAPEDRQMWVSALKAIDIDVEVLMPEAESLGILGISRHGDRLTAIVAMGQLALRQRALKRCFDLAAVLWLLPLLVLVTVLVALLIKFDDGGPIFFIQKRIGQGNRLFSMVKFRSMAIDKLDLAGNVSTARGDHRITRVGAFLRGTSIDELPQLFNVIKGDMSVVGPRPHATGSTADKQLFWAVDQRYWARHAAKPGLTGLAQVRGFRGTTETRDDLVNRIQSDLEYVSGWSLWRDVRILVATVPVIVHPSAY